MALEVAFSAIGTPSLEILLLALVATTTCLGFFYLVFMLDEICHP